MSKNIIVCSDGTWNGPGRDENNDGIPELTNVLKLFGNLAGTVSVETAALQNEQEKALSRSDGSLSQVAKYLHGVGDSRNRIRRLLGGVFGAGLIDRIVRGYTYVCRNYKPGDAIHIVGFSRGAYTARAIGGMIATVGLLDASKLDLSNAETRYRYGIGAWVKYRQKSRNVDSALFGYLLEFAGLKVNDAELVPNVPIRSIAVWDTVGSYGVPAYALQGGRVDLFRFADHKLSDKVKNGFHAVSIDERRSDFVPTLWDEAANVTQVWFAGAHSDVGGGYPQAGLSDIALDWMMKRLEETGVEFSAPPAYTLKQDHTIKLHTPWSEAPWHAFPPTDRSVPQGAWVHASVVRRGDPNARAMQNLMRDGKLEAERYRVVEWSPPQLPA
jgi:glutathione S-transferase